MTTISAPLPTPVRTGGVPARAIWAWARLIGGAAILAVLAWRLGTAGFLEALRVIDAPAVAAALGIGALITLFSAWRWCVVARGLGLPISLWGAVADYYRAVFLNAALPGGILGDVHRAVQHGRDAGDLGRGVRAVVLERTAGQLVVLTGCVTVLLAYPSPALASARLMLSTSHTSIAVAALAVAGAGVALWRSRRSASRWGRAVRGGLRELRAGVLAPRALPWVALSSAMVLAGHLATFVVAARAAGASAPLTQLAPLLVLALLAMALPLNVGGWGPREGVCAWAFGAAGLGATQGLTVAVVYGLLAFVASLPGAAVLLARGIGAVRARRDARPA